MRKQHCPTNSCRSGITLSLCLVAALLTGACASHTTVSSSWHDKSEKNTPFTNVLVVGLSDNTDKRLTFEDAVVYDLRGPNTKAWASARLMGSSETVNEENLRKIVTEKQADAVIVTTVTSMEIKAVEAGGRTDVIENQQATGMGIVPERRTGTVFTYNYNETVEPVYITSEYTTVLTTEVYSASSGKNVYTVVTSSAKQETLAEVIDVLSDAIAARLRADGVIR